MKSINCFLANGVSDIPVYTCPVVVPVKLREEDWRILATEHVCVCVCVCVHEREGGREGGRER